MIVTITINNRSRKEELPDRQMQFEGDYEELHTKDWDEAIREGLDDVHFDEDNQNL